MTAVIGLFRRDRSPVERSAVQAMSEALTHRGSAGGLQWSDDSVALGWRRAGESAGVWARHAASQTCLVADARIDNRPELTAALGLPADAPSSHVILHAYLRWGADAAAHLLGDFAFVIWDARTRELFCARDPMGVKPLYYHLSPRLFAFATESRALHALPEVPRTLDEEQVAVYLAWGQPDRQSTLVRGVRRLQAAHTLTLREGGPPVLKRYWSLADAPAAGCATAGDHVARFREIFTEAVRCRMPEHGPVAAALSGGLDSSAITCTARQLQQHRRSEPLHAISLVFPDLSAEALRLIDERRFVETVVEGGGMQWHPVAGDQLSPLTDIEQVLWHLDEPSAAPNLYLHWAMYAAAAGAGASVFLDGLDGDSTVGHGYGRLDGLMRRGSWDGFEAEVRAFAGHRGMDAVRVLPHYGLPYLDELARQHRWSAWTRAARELTRRFPLSRRAVLFRHGLKAGAPAGLRRLLPTGAPAAHEGVLHPRLARYVRQRELAGDTGVSLDERASHIAGLDQPGFQATLEIADRSAAAFGVEPRYPFFDRRLMEFCVQVPPELKFSEGWSRLILRRAMEGILPAEVQWRSSKANLSPNFQQQFCARDRAAVEGTDLRALEPYVDVARLEGLRRRFFSDPKPTWGDPRMYLLFRATSLARWQQVRTMDRGTVAARAA